MEKAEHQHYRQHHEVKIGRLEALVDAVFAFAMTLLVLNLVVPRALSAADFDATLLGLTQDILIYFLSFVILGSIWMIINWQATHIERSDTIHLWVGIFLLMFVALAPFATYILTEYIGTTAADIFFAADVMMIGLFLFANWFYATENHRLVSSSLDRKTISRGRFRSLIIIGVGALVMAVSVFLPGWSAFIYLFIPVLSMFFLVDRGGN